MTRRIAIPFLFGLTLALPAPETAMADRYNQTETPHYTATLTEGDIELRDYAPRLMAEVTVAGNRSQAANAGFRVLADYIFGGNATATSIAMTTPVAQTPASPAPGQATATGSGTWVIQFMMPAGFTQANLPPPRDPSIRFVTLPAERLAVLRFSGTAGAATLDDRAQALRGWIAAKGLTIADGPRFFFYDPPWTLPWNRRNEVAFVLR